MDYSPKQRIARGFLAFTVATAAAGCRPQNATSAGDRLESAEDLYRQARAIEDRVATSDPEAQGNLQQARTLYIRALGANPSQDLEAYIRTGLGNVAFYQNDYRTAVEQWTAAYDQLKDPNLRAMTLLRMGMARQRLGQWDQADRDYQLLQQQYPNSSPAQVARTKTGARQFYVQVAVFSVPALADKAVAQLRREGLTPTRTTDPQGRQVIRVGPLYSYADALRVKQRLAAMQPSYPTAAVTP